MRPFRELLWKICVTNVGGCLSVNGAKNGFEKGALVVCLEAVKWSFCLRGLMVCQIQGEGDQWSLSRDQKVIFRMIDKDGLWQFLTGLAIHWFYRKHLPNWLAHLLAKNLQLRKICQSILWFSWRWAEIQWGRTSPGVDLWWAWVEVCGERWRRRRSRWPAPWWQTGTFGQWKGCKNPIRRWENRRKKSTR